MLSTEAARLDWVFDGQPNREGLEQFAVSIAALASNEATPLAVLENVLATVAENLNASSALAAHDSKTMLSEKAAALGYDDVQMFRKDLVECIGQYMNNIRLTGISQQQRLIHRKYSLR
ncbi:MAG: hypothetical protein MRY32_06805 [Rickettsiales bacterium]|nr:hypothetical protein [Rickettsiales bacterium]